MLCPQFDGTWTAFYKLPARDQFCEENKLRPSKGSPGSRVATKKVHVIVFTEKKSIPIIDLPKQLMTTDKGI